MRRSPVLFGSAARRARGVSGARQDPGTGGDTSARASDAFTQEALGYLDSLYRTALRLTRSAEDAEDLVQDTYLRAFRAADRFEPGTNLRAWLFTILHNGARNRARDRARDIVSIDSETVDQASDGAVMAASSAGVADGPWRSAGTESPESLLIRRTLTPELQAAIDRLPDSFRQAVWLRDVEEFSYAEIAEMLGIPAGTVMSRISRGRRMLFNQLHHLTPINA